MDSEDETCFVEFEPEYDGFNAEIQSTVADYSYKVLSSEQIVDYMKMSIKEVNAVVDIPATTARILLNHFKWNTEKLLERLYDGDQDELFTEARIVNPFEKFPHSESGPPGSDTEETCLICYSICSIDTMTGLDCGHRFCTACWGEYLTRKIKEESVGQTIACPAHACEILADDQTVMRIIDDSTLRLKYQQLMTKGFVEANPLLRWCPSPDCSYAIKVTNVESRSVECKCQHVFCFACGENSHDPVKCNLLTKWWKKCGDDSETSNWIAIHTKECPKCKATIEKDGGCNHMICRNQDCQNNFCWVCLGPWEPHRSSWYKCNRYDDKKAKAARGAQEKSRASLKRYLFFYNRFMNHLESIKLEKKLRSFVKEKLERHAMSGAEGQFLTKAVEILNLCRQTLMYTYIFAYFLKETNQSTIFETNQRDLESATETLSGYLERDITSQTLSDVKQKVLDKSRYCQARRKALVEHVNEGYEKDWWEYIEES